MAKIIEFFIPGKYRKAGKRISPRERKKIILFGLHAKKSA